MRTFEAVAAKRGATPLLIGITGASFSGKTFSALRLAHGIQRIVGGKIVVIDTENRRASHYAEGYGFEFEVINMSAPFSPLDYLAALEHCAAIGATVVVVDSMTHEHNGEGGVMDQSEQWLDAKCGDDEWKRQKNFMLSLVKPKQQRKKLNRRIVHLGMNAIFCYRAVEKVKPTKGGEPESHGWQPETTSPLHYEMMARFLLEPGCDGKPTINPDNKYEALHTKHPEQFRGWFREGMQLSEDTGERMAQWASGEFVLPSGEHKGKGIGSVPSPYLEKLAAHEKTSEVMKRRCEGELKRRRAEVAGSPETPPSEPAEPEPHPLGNCGYCGEPLPCKLDCIAKGNADGPNIEAGEMSEAEQQQMKREQQTGGSDGTQDSE